jgi:hypothetical protein
LGFKLDNPALQLLLALLSLLDLSSQTVSLALTIL